MRTKHLYFIVFFTLLFSPVWAQVSGVVNLYAKVNTINTTCSQLSLGSALGFNPGDKVLVIQMKGATVVTANGSTYGDITALNAAGNYEFNVIDYISGNDLFLRYTLMYPYNVAGSVQVIKVAEYSDVTVTGPIVAQPWDGNTGGVVVMDVSGTLTLNAGISVSNQGFRGGTVNPGAGTTCGQNFYVNLSTNTLAGHKGEGISDFLANNLAGRGKHANGGGSGMSNNSGAGGGGNYGAGGIGGSQSSSCLGGAPGFPGLGGLAMTYSNTANRIFLGGGGGGGHQNNFVSPGPPAAAGATPGGTGGGIIIISANIIEGNGNTIEAKGQALDTPAWGDSGGGGGAGGTVLLSYNTLNSAVQVDVRGGKGDRVYTETNRNLGPGGGGAGGILWVNKPSIDPLITLTAAGGQPGTSTNYDPSLAVPCQCPYNATAGANGGSLTGLNLQVASTPFPSCGGLPVSLLYFKARQEGNAVALNWSTAWEKDNEAFIVQRSEDGVTFYTLNEIPAAACQQNCVYSYTDHSSRSGKVYYRLLQKDVSGQPTAIGSAIIEINSDILAQLVYPQPASELLHVELKSDLPVQLRLVDLTGKEHFIHYTQQDRLLTLQLSVPPGLYTLWLNNQQYAETVKVIVQ